MPNKKCFWTEAMDALLRRTYDPNVKDRSQEIARRLRMPRWTGQPPFLGRPACDGRRAEAA